MKLRLSSDEMSVFVSLLCLMHCIAVPLFLLFGFDFVHRLIDQEWIEWTIIGLALVVGMVAFIGGFIAHRQHFVPVLFVAGFLLLINGESVAQTWSSASLSIAGALVIIYAHVQNLKWKRHAIAR